MSELSTEKLLKQMMSSSGVKNISGAGTGTGNYCGVNVLNPPLTFTADAVGQDSLADSTLNRTLSDSGYYFFRVKNVNQTNGVGDWIIDAG